MVTGLCSFNVQDDGTLPIWGIEHWQLDHIGIGLWFEQWRETVAGSGDTGPDTFVVIESFIITPGTSKKTQAPWSLESIGAVRYFVETAGLHLNMVPPSSHKRLVSNDVLKRAGLYFPGEDHATDAARVGLYFVLTNLKLLHWTLRGEDESEKTAS